MRVTIGTLANEVAPFSKLIEIKLLGDRTPYLRALLENEAGFTAAYLYVVQMGEETYSVCETDDEMFGEKYLPTGGSSEPFILEKNFIRQWANVEREKEEEYVEKDLTQQGFISYFYKLLAQLEITRISENQLELPISSLGFSTFRLTRVFDQLLGTGATLHQFISAGRMPGAKFQLEGIREKDLKELHDKFLPFGITFQTEGRILYDLQVEKKNPKRISYSSGEEDRLSFKGIPNNDRRETFQRGKRSLNPPPRKGGGKPYHQ